MVDIRGFQNSDVPELVRIWTEHWSSLGLPVHVSNTIFEQAILARSFFNPANLLVAENDGSVLAWCHFAPRVGSDASSSTPCDALVNALVFSDAGYEHCDQLLGSVEHQLATSHDRLFVGLIQDEDQGYVGLSPIGAGVGIIEHDARTSALLHARGYQPQSHAQKLVVFTRDYRAPVSRDAMQLRRKTHIESRRIRTEGLRQASALSHLDVERHSLVDRTSSETLASVKVFVGDVEVDVMNCSEAILSIDQGNDHIATSYLISCLIHQLSGRGIQSIETVVQSEHVDLIDQLSKAKLQASISGAQWHKQIK